MSDFFQKLSLKAPLKIAILALFLLVGGLTGVGTVYAGSCTYGEAMMALEKGNTVRGLVLMRMASRDGDQRAERYLREQDSVAGLSVPVTTQLTLATASRH